VTALWQRVERTLAHPWRRAALGAILFLLILVIDRWMSGGAHTLFAMGIADETAHLSTMVIVLLPFPALRNASFILGCLVGSVAIDVDHIPLYLGSDSLTAQTNRPFTHGLLTMVIVLALGLIAGGRWRGIGLGLVVGLGVHFLRDMATSTAGVPLLWPVVATGYTIPYPIYATVMALALLATLAASVVDSAKQRGPGR
jgi:inner membrane protein